MRVKFYSSILTLLLTVMLCGVALSQVHRECWDNDGDGYEDIECGGIDCDDDNPDVFPSNAENCHDGIDNDCDELIDYDDTTECTCTDGDGDGFALNGGGCGEMDCDDSDPNTYPGALELCDGKDNDCDEEIPSDESDADLDGYRICEGDCDDHASSVNPGANETCNHIDDNCDSQIDEGFDQDSDGYTTCAEPVPDCDDTNSEVYPGHVEIPGNGIDDNCDGEIDECLIKTATGNG